jgi:hypothetical protein
MEELKGISAIARALPKEGIPPALLETTTKASNLIGTGESLTVDGLLEQAVFGSDPEFKGAFLNTYRWKIDTPTLFTTLSKRINDPEHPLTNEQSKQVYSFLKQWIADPNICRNEAHLALDFLSSHDLQPITVGDGTQDSNFSWEDLKSGAKTAANSPVEIPTRIGVKEADPKRTHEEVLNIAGLQNLMNQIEHPKNEKMLLQQVASELSNEAMQAFSLLDAHDFEKLAWTKKKDPHYQGVVNNANQVGIMVQAAILYSNDTTKAAEFMVKLAENLRQNGDFHTFGAIVMGLQGNAFNRLEVPMDPAIKKLAMEHRALIHPQKSFGMLRAELKKWEGKPHIPYTGMLNQDLNFIDEGNNFSKEGKLASGIFKQINDIYSTFFNSKNYQLPAMVPPNQSLGLAAVVNSLPNNANKALDAKSYAIRERGK